MEHNIVKKYLELQGKIHVKPPAVEKATKKKMDDQYIAPEPVSAINQIIEKKPALKYVVEYLQARVDELNEIEMNS
jgi:hypothetical protein